MVNELTKKQFSLLHLIIGFFVTYYVADEKYIAAVIVFVVGVIFHSAMDMLKEQMRGTK